MLSIYHLIINPTNIGVFRLKLPVFSQLLFQNSFFFKAKLLQSSHFLTLGSYLEQLLFEATIFLAKELFRKKDIYRRTTFSKLFLHIINFFRKATFWKKLLIQKSNALYYLLFLESCLFRAAAFSKDATFYSITFSGDLLFYKILFRKSYYFTATLPFHSYTTYLFVSN